MHYRAAKEDDLVPGQGAFRTRDELVHSSFSTAQVGASVSHVGMPMAGEVGEGAGVQRVCFLGLGTPSPCLLRVCNLDWMKVVHERIHMHTGCARALAKTSLESQAPQRMHTRRHAHRHTHMRARAHTGTHTCAHAHSRRHTHAHIQAESLTKLFPAGSALAKVFEAQELKEKEKAQELKEKEEAREFKEKKREEEVKQRLDILSLAVGILVFLLLAQSHGIPGAFNTVFKSVLRI